MGLRERRGDEVSGGLGFEWSFIMIWEVGMMK